MVYAKEIEFKGICFIFGLMACYSIISIIFKASDNGYQHKYWSYFTKYTMPIFLMHTIFAASLRAVLLKVGITNSFVHILMGLVITFMGSIMAMKIFELLRPLDFFVYPSKYLKFKK